MNLVALQQVGLTAGSRSLRILMVCARYLPLMGGTEMHVYEVSRRMAANGHTVSVLTTDRTGKLPAREILEGVTIVRRRAWPESSDLYFSPGIWSEIANGAWDVIHVQGYHTLVAPTAMAAAIQRKTPFVLTFHSGGHSSPMRNALRGTQGAVLRPLAKRAAQLIGVSRFEADEFSRRLGIPRDRFVVLNNGAQLPTPTARKVSADAPLIVSIGRLERYKGHQRVIGAFPTVLRRSPKARLRIVGSGPFEPELRKQVAGLGLEQSVEIGSIPAGERSAMADLLAQASVVTLLSDYEAHPVAVMEAVSLGAPVLTGNSSGFIELAEQGMVQAIDPDSGPQAVAEAIQECLVNPPPKVAVSLPGWTDCAAALLSIYARVADRKA